MPSALSDPKYWQLRAEEARVIAESMEDQEARKITLTVVQNYEQMVRRAAILVELANTKKPKRG
jgi:hypothetical protein